MLGAPQDFTSKWVKSFIPVQRCNLLSQSHLSSYRIDLCHTLSDYCVRL